MPETMITALSRAKHRGVHGHRPRAVEESAQVPRRGEEAIPLIRGTAVMARIIRLHTVFSEGQSATSLTLASELGVTERTVKRDIALMRDGLGCPLAWDPARHSYVYTRSCDLLPLLRLTGEEAISLALANHVFAAWAGSPLGQALETALEKIARVTAGAVSIPVSSVRGLITRPTGEEGGRSECRHFPVLVEAIQRGRELRLQYQKPRASQPELRVVHPLHLALLDHEWVLVAWDVGRRAPRNFLLSRVHSCRHSGVTFDPPKEFDVHAYLAGSIGRFAGTETHDVHVSFDGTAAPYVKERPWHPSQTITRENSDGSVEVRYRLNNLVDVQRRVLACGRHARVLAPATLRRAIEEELAAALQTYSAAEETPLAAAEGEGSYSQGHATSSPVR